MTPVVKGKRRNLLPGDWSLCEMFSSTACNMNHFLGVGLTCPFLFIFSHDENYQMPSNVLFVKGTGVLGGGVQQLLC